MGFMSHRRRHVEVHPEQKWDYISLNDFKSTSCFTPFAYVSLWVSLFISVAVYAVDTFTAVQLLAFNRWSGQIQPFIRIDVSKWIFSICIILSFVNVGFEHIRAQRIMRRGSVAECFLDSLAARLESIKLGKSSGWRRFLVFAELTKSKKGAEYVALFTYFSFQSWIRVILCSGPRQVINALTLWSVFQAKLSADGNDFEHSLVSFFDKVRILATEDYRQAVILCGMLFTLVIWVFSFLSLLLAAFFFVFFLWHYIPRADGGLTGFCERKVNKRLKQIVSVKINKAMAEDERKRKKAAMKNGEDRPMTMQATLPHLSDDKLPEMPALNRADTMTTLPPYTSRPGTPGSFELNTLDQKRPLPSRTATTASSTSQFSNAQYSSTTSLLGGAAAPGMARSGSPTPTLPPTELDGYPPVRPGTAASSRTYGPGAQLQRLAFNGAATGNGYTASPATYGSETMPAFPPPVRSPTGGPNGGQNGGPDGGPNVGLSGYRGGPRSNQAPARSYTGGSRPPYDGNRPFDEFSNGRASPAPSTSTYRNGPLSPPGLGPNGYPMRSATNPIPPRGQQEMGPDGYPMRSATNPMPPRGQQEMGPDGYPIRSATNPPPRGPQEMGTDGYPMRSATNPPPRGPQEMGPDGYPMRSATNPPPRGPQEMGTDGYPMRSATNAMPSRGPIFPQETGPGGYPMRSNTNSTSQREPLSTQRTGPDGYPVRSATNPMPPRGPPQSRMQPPQRQQSPGPRFSDEEAQEGDGYGFPSRPMTANSQRTAPHGGYGNNNGWNQDVERGSGPRY
ncbi:hypothetical protein B0T22DRAFT_288912 [Podospora appendiculata]|uniref:Vacuolar membrane protein n=1 Tax=Podospora appendiculata TaxID=314037 RepID=A0AAE0X1M2_9PEZI|nr:hypothetical protein B0T22DRAFT_288912 [Podospora appendiculata]